MPMISRSSPRFRSSNGTVIRARFRRLATSTTALLLLWGLHGAGAGCAPIQLDFEPPTDGGSDGNTADVEAGDLSDGRGFSADDDAQTDAGADASSSDDAGDDADGSFGDDGSDDADADPFSDASPDAEDAASDADFDADDAAFDAPFDDGGDDSSDGAFDDATTTD